MKNYVTGISAMILVCLSITACKKYIPGTFVSPPPDTTTITEIPAIKVTGAQYVMSPILLSTNIENIERIEWDMGDKNTLYTETVTHNYYEPGQYTVNATVYTKNSTYQLTKDLFVVLGAKRMESIRTWEVTKAFKNVLDASYSKITTEQITFGLESVTDYEIMIPESGFIPNDPEDQASFIKHFYINGTNYFQYVKTQYDVTAILRYYYLKDSITLEKRCNYHNPKDTARYGIYIMRYHTQ